MKSLLKAISGSSSGLKFGCKYCELESNEMNVCKNKNDQHNKNCPRYLGKQLHV